MVKGTANARVQASVLSLYDSLRVQGPKRDGDYVSWDVVDEEVMAALAQSQAAGKDIVLLTQTLSSPSTYKMIAEFAAKYGSVKHVEYDAISEDAALDAFQARFGERALADYDFSKAEVIISFGADFLGDWQGGGFDGGYAKGRVPANGKMSRHVQFESNMSLSGANADKRVPVTPSQQKVALAKFYGYLSGVAVSGQLPESVDVSVKAAAMQVKKAGSKAVVVTGIQDVNAQSLVLAINESLSSAAMDVKTPLLVRKGNVKALAQLISDMNSGKVGVLLMSGVNPLIH